MPTSYLGLVRRNTNRSLGTSVTSSSNSRNLNDIIDEFNKYAAEYNKKISDTHTKKIAMTFEYNHKQIIDGKYTNFK